MDILFYLNIILLLLICIFFLNKNVKENFDSNIQPGPWGVIGTGKPWYNYPYILHNIEY